MRLAELRSRADTQTDTRSGGGGGGRAAHTARDDLMNPPLEKPNDEHVLESRNEKEKAEKAIGSLSFLLFCYCFPSFVRSFSDSLIL